MILVSDIIGEVSQVLGRCDQTYLFSVLTRAVETLARKACAVSITFDPLMIYVDLPVQQDYYVFLPYQIEKPIRVNINGNPTFSRPPLYEFTLNGPGSNDLEAGWQWQERLTGPIQRKWPRGAFQLRAISDSEADTELDLTIKVRGRSRTDYIITLPIAPAGTTPSLSNSVYGVIEVVKPPSVGTVSLYAGPYLLANYYPSITLPEFSCIKLSQKAVGVRMLARRKTMPITSLLDVIPLNSSQAVVMQCQAIKYYDEVHFDLAQAAEQQAVTYLNEEQAARNAYFQSSTATEVATALNLTIGQRDVVICADIYDEAARIFGFIGRPKIFDRITSTMELLYNKCQYWDGLTGVVTLRADQDYYIALPRYVDTILAMNVNRTIGAYHSPWFEFSYAGLGEFGDLQQQSEGWQPWSQLAQQQGSTNASVYPYSSGWGSVGINGSNRLGKGWEEVGTTPFAFRLRGPAALYAQPELGQDNGARITVYGYLQESPVLNSRGQWGVDIPCYANRFAPSKYVFDRVERVTKDPTYGFINLFAVNPFYNANIPIGTDSTGCPDPAYPQEIPPACVVPGPFDPASQTDFVAMYWPWDIEPQYRLIRVGTMCKRVRIRYKRNWAKIAQLTDPLHVRSREAIILAMTAVAAMRTGGAGAASTPFMPTAGVQIAMDQLQLAVQLLDDEWAARNPHATISLQWPRSTYGNAFEQVG
jgi:hypothetical protein